MGEETTTVNQAEVEQRPGAEVAEEQRKEPRFPSDLSAILTVLASGNVTEARTVDVSKSGLRVRSPEPVATGERLRIQFSSTIAFGEARWCKDIKGTGYDIGIQVEHSLAESFVASLHAALKRVREAQ